MEHKSVGDGHVGGGVPSALKRSSAGFSLSLWLLLDPLPGSRDASGVGGASSQGTDLLWPGAGESGSTALPDSRPQGGRGPVLGCGRDTRVGITSPGLHCCGRTVVVLDLSQVTALQLSTYTVAFSPGLQISMWKQLGFAPWFLSSS